MKSRPFLVHNEYGVTQNVCLKCEAADKARQERWVVGKPSESR